MQKKENREGKEKGKKRKEKEKEKRKCESSEMTDYISLKQLAHF